MGEPRRSARRTMRPDRHLFQRIWSTDEGLTALLGFLVLFVFVLHPVIELWRAPRVLVEVFFSMVLISGVAAVGQKRSTALLATAFAVVSLSTQWVGHVFPSPSLAMANAGFSFTFCALLAFLVLRQVLADGPVTRHRIQGAVAVYLLLGLAWGFAYKLVALGQAGAFSFSSSHDSTSLEQLTASMAYFSFMTLTTVGYGDVLPVSELARTLAVLEGLVGQLFPAVLLARLVSLEIYYRQPPSRAPSDDADD